jgi:MFS family permease
VVAGVTTLLLMSADHILGWISLRAVTGFCSGALTTLLEGRLQMMTPSSIRGRVGATYSTVSKVAGLIGQSLIAAQVNDNFIFALCAATLFLGLVPIVLLQPAEDAPAQQGLDLRPLLRLPIVAASGCAAAGLLAVVLAGLAPVYVLQAGFTVADAGFVALSMQASSIVVQWPFAWVADKIDGRVVVAIMAGTIAVGAILILLSSKYLAVVAGFSVAGGVSQALYNQSSADAYDVVDRADIMSIASGLNLLWAMGSVVGPLIATYCMEISGRSGLPVYAVVVSLSVVMFAVWNIASGAKRG